MARAIVRAVQDEAHAFRPVPLAHLRGVQVGETDGESGEESGMPYIVHRGESISEALKLSYDCNGVDLC